MEGYETICCGYLYLVEQTTKELGMHCYYGEIKRLRLRTDYPEKGKYRYWFTLHEGCWFDLISSKPGVLCNYKRFESDKAGMWLWLPVRNDYEAKKIFESYFRSKIKKDRKRIAIIRLAEVKLEDA